MTAEFYTNNRQKLLDKLEGTGVILLYSGKAPVKSNDQDMSPFSVNRNFYYLTGIDTQNVWLMLAKTKKGVRSWLFIDQPDEEIIKWNGKMLTRERASERSGIKSDNIIYMQDLERYTAMYLSNGLTDVYFSFDRRSMLAPPTRAEEFARTIREKFPMAQIKNIAPAISSLRAIKTPEEIECIRKAGDVTIEALKEKAYSLVGRPDDLEWEDQVVAILEARDGTILDVVRKIRPYSPEA